MLFVPGSRPDRFAGALASDADRVCIDLEDSVPPDGKDAARCSALAALDGNPRLALRINGLSTRDGLADLLAVATCAHPPALLYLPMVEAAAEVAMARKILANPSIGLVPLIETIAGLDAAPAIARDPGVSMLMFGGGDFSAQLGVALAWEPLLLARQRLVMAGAAADKPVMDVPFIALDDEAGLAAECARARAIGFSAKAAIHPSQLSAIHAAFRPTRADVAEAEAALAAFAAAGGVPVRYRGQLLEAPLMRRYRQTAAFKGVPDA